MREDRETPYYASPPILAQSDRKANSPLGFRTGSWQGMRQPTNKHVHGHTHIIRHINTHTQC